MLVIDYHKAKIELLSFFFFFCLLSFLGPPQHVAFPRLGVESELVAAYVVGLHHSHSNAGSEPCLLPTPQLMVTPEP